MPQVSPRLREVLVGVTLTPLYILFRGYAFGIRDHAIHLAYIERAADPAFLPGDPMLDVAAHHPSFFFQSLALLSHLASLECIYFVAYALSVFAMIVGLRSLARSLWDGPSGEWAAAVAVAGVFVHRYVAGGIENFDALFIPRGASLGLLLYALALGVKRRYYLAFGLTGVVFLIHATTAAHTAFILWVCCALGGRSNLRQCLLGPLIFLTGAAPLLFIIAVHGGPDIPTPAPESWVQSLKLHYAFHHFPRPWVIVAKVGPGIIAVLLGIVVSRWRGAGRTLTGLLAGALGLIVAGGIGNSLLSWPVTVHLHLFEAGRILDLLALVALGRWSFSVLGCPWPVKLAGCLTVASYLVRIKLYEGVRYTFVADFYLLIIALMVTVLERRGLAERLRLDGIPRSWYALIAASCILLMIVSGWIPVWKFSGADQRGYRLMQWARVNLATDAVVIIPPYMEEPIAAFRYFARRRAIGSWKDGGEGTFDFEFQLRWERQVREITGIGDRIRVPKGPVFWMDYFDWLYDAHQSYHRMPAQHFLDMARVYGASHVVREAWSPRLSLPILYQDEEYVLYAVPRSQDGG